MRRLVCGLLVAHGDWRLAVLRPLSLTLYAVGALVLLGPPLLALARRRRAADAVNP